MPRTAAPKKTAPAGVKSNGAKGTSKIVPLADRLVVRQVRQEEVLASGIVIPDTAQEKPQQGEVLAVGPGRVEEGKRIALEVKVGDRILFSKYSGQEVKLGTEEFLVLKESDVLAKISL